MEAICIMMGCKGKKGEKGVIDYWDDSKRLLNDPEKFLNRLENYDRDGISESLVNKLTNFF